MAVSPNLNTIGALLAIVDSAESQREKVQRIEESLMMVRDLYRNIRKLKFLSFIVIPFS